MHQCAHYEAHLHTDQQAYDECQAVGHQLDLPLFPQCDGSGELDSEEHRVDNDGREGGGGNVGHEGAEEGDGENDD